MKFDLHLHTSRHSLDSIMAPELMVQRARELSLDGVVITEHDWLWTDAELAQLRRSASVIVFAGIEVSAKQGHFLVYGVSNPFAVPNGIGVAELCREVHRQGGAIVAAHPYRWNQPLDDILESCHAQANFGTGANPPNYTADRYIDMTGPQFRGFLKVDFLWSIADNAH